MKIQVKETREHYHEIQFDEDIDIERFESLLKSEVVHNDDIFDAMERALDELPADCGLTITEDAYGTSITAVECEDTDW